MIKCIVCKEAKGEEEYNWRNKSQGRRKNYCRTCDRVIKKRHYDNNRADIIAQVRARTAMNVDRFQQWKSQLKCTLCPETDSCCLDFHHLDPTQKDFGISEAVPSMSWEALMEEVNKCIVVCKNCHTKVHKYGLDVIRQRG
jgi:hypothetical protein